MITVYPIKLPELAVVNGATGPNPGQSNSLAWSLVENKPVIWASVGGVWAWRIFGGSSGGGGGEIQPYSPFLDQVIGSTPSFKSLFSVNVPNGQRHVITITGGGTPTASSFLLSSIGQQIIGAANASEVADLLEIQGSVVIQPNEPTDTSVLWVDTDDTTGEDGGGEYLPIRHKEVEYLSTLIITTQDADDITITELEGDLTLDLTGGYQGQRVVIEIKQDSVGGHTLTFGPSIVFGADLLPSDTISMLPNSVSVLGFRYVSSLNKYQYIALNKGF